MVIGRAVVDVALVEVWLSYSVSLRAVTDVLWWTGLLCFPAYRDEHAVVGL